MKAFLLTLVMMCSLSALGQVEVSSSLIDLGEVHETLGSSTKKIILKLSPSTPNEFKVKFKYKYRFKSTEIASAYVGANGQLGIITRKVSSELYIGKETLQVDVENSTLSEGGELKVLLEISKPNKNTHSVKVVATLIDAKEDVISGRKKLLGLLGRSYQIQKATCSQE
jgi:hypothetical protein